MKISLNNIKTGLNKLRTPKNTEMAAIWGIPTIVVPSLRYVNDKDKPKNIRNELFLRDFAGYAIGTAIFMGVWKGLTKFTKTKHIQAITAAATSSAIWCGYIAPKLSKLFTGEEWRPIKLPAQRFDIKEGEPAFSQNKPNIYKRVDKKLNPQNNIYSTTLLSQLNYSGYHKLKI